MKSLHLARPRSLSLPQAQLPVVCRHREKYGPTAADRPVGSHDSEHPHLPAPPIRKKRPPTRGARGRRRRTRIEQHERAEGLRRRRRVLVLLRVRLPRLRPAVVGPARAQQLDGHHAAACGRQQRRQARGGRPGRRAGRRGEEALGRRRRVLAAVRGARSAARPPAAPAGAEAAVVGRGARAGAATGAAAGAAAGRLQAMVVHRLRGARRRRRRRRKRRWLRLRWWLRRRRGRGRRGRNGRAAAQHVEGVRLR